MKGLAERTGKRSENEFPGYKKLGNKGTNVMAMLNNVRSKRLRARRYFLTFAACPIPIETAKNQLMGRFMLDYLLISQETAPTTGNLHLHALLLFKGLFSTNDTAVFNIKDDNGQEFHPNIQVVQSLTWAINYIKKDGKWQEVGQCPIKLKRMEMKEKLEFMKNNDIEAIIDSGNFSIAEIKNAMMIKREIGKTEWKWPFFKERKVYWFYGPTGCGKTRRAVAECREFAENDWTILSGNLRNFLVGYRGEKAVIIDDIRAGTIEFSQLLRYTDGYRCLANIKGSHIEWVAERIYITAPIRPEDMFKVRDTDTPWDHVDQLLRRLAGNVIEITGNDEVLHEFRQPAPETLNQTNTEVLSDIHHQNVPHLHDSNEAESFIQPALEPIWEWEGAP